MVARAWQHMADILVEPENNIRPRLYYSEFPGWHFADGWTTGRLMNVRGEGGVSVGPSVGRSVGLCVSVCLGNLFVCLSVCLSLWLSVGVFVCRPDGLVGNDLYRCDALHTHTTMPQSHTGPFAITIHKDGHLVILVRLSRARSPFLSVDCNPTINTISSSLTQSTNPKPPPINPQQMRGSTVDDDWQSNFHYPFCSEEEAEATGLPGRVHGGFLRYVQALIPSIDAEMERLRPCRVSLAGDSLGGAVANLMGAYIARAYEGMIQEKARLRLRLRVCLWWWCVCGEGGAEGCYVT
jgi:hypothetical protein